MQATAIRRDQYMTTRGGRPGAQPWTQRVEYETFRSKFGPKYKVARHWQGINATNGGRYALMAGMFGASAGIFAVFFFGGVPRVRKDILQKVPVLGDYFVHEIPPEDNPF